MKTNRNFPHFKISFLFVLVLALFTACGDSADVPAVVAEAYIEALAEKDLGRMVQASCSRSQGEARAEFDLYAGYETSLGEVQCTSVESTHQNATVWCSGSLIAADTIEARPIPIEGRIFHLANDGHMWKICGDSP